MGSAMGGLGCNPRVPEIAGTGTPFWCSSMYVDPEMEGGFASVSDGITQISANQVSRERKGTAITDGARWCKGMTSGKHVFHVVWPAKNNRGTHSAIGVATTDVPLKKQGKFSLVGCHSGGWCLDLSRRRSYHTDVQLAICRYFIGDRFYMYVDMDSGKIAFGEDISVKGDQAEFWGDLVTGITTPPPSPLFVMISSIAWKENVQVTYKGTACPPGGFDLMSSVLPPPVAAPPCQPQKTPEPVSAAPHDTKAGEAEQAAEE